MARRDEFLRGPSTAVSIRELRSALSEVLARVERGERFIVTVSRRPVAQLVPLQRHRTVPLEEALRRAGRYALDQGADTSSEGPRQSPAGAPCEP